MRWPLIALLAMGFSKSVAAQPAAAPAAPRDGIAIGLQITPTLDGLVDPWLKWGVRVSAPLGTRLGIDVEAGRILGGRTAFPDSSVGKLSVN